MAADGIFMTSAQMFMFYCSEFDIWYLRFDSGHDILPMATPAILSSRSSLENSVLLFDQ